MARQARSLDVLLAEINAAHGKRSKVSDGGLGDAAHASRDSDHNVNEAGVWRARDFTNDLVDDNRDGFDDDMLDCDELARRLVAMYHEQPVHPAMGPGAYTIWERRIYSYNRRAEGWRPYDGANPHDKHLHQSVATAASGYDSTAPWGVMEDDMYTAADRARDDKAAAQTQVTHDRVFNLARVSKLRFQIEQEQDAKRHAELKAELAEAQAKLDALEN